MRMHVLNLNLATFESVAVLTIILFLSHFLCVITSLSVCIYNVPSLMFLFSLPPVLVCTVNL